MSSAVDSRLKNANLGSWHQLVSLNEGMINQQFKNMWALADNTSAIKTFQHTKPHTSPPETMTAVLGPPRIKLRIDGSNLSSVIYFIDMLQGSSMSTFKDADSNDMVTIDMTNWSIACKVDVGSRVVPDTDPAAQGFRNEHQGDLPDWEFSLGQLFLDMSAAQSMLNPQSGDPDQSTFSGTGWANATTYQKTNVNDFINNWFGAYAMETPPKNIFGWTLHPTGSLTNGGATKAFRTTLVEKQNYPWRDPQNPGNDQNGLSTNEFLYKIMTNDAAAPTPELLSWTGNWVSDDTTGNFACSNVIFFEQWLCPIVQQINRWANITPGQPTAETSGAGTKASGTTPYTVGGDPDHNDPNDTFYAYKSVTNMTDSKGWPVQYAWTPADISHSASDYSGVEANPLLAVRYTESATRKATIAWQSGSQEINIEGTTVFKDNADYWGSNTSAFDTYSHGTMTLTWSMSIFLHAVSDGGLQIVVGDPQYQDPSDSSKKHYWKLDAPDPDRAGTFWVSDNSVDVQNDIRTRVTAQMGQLDNVVSWIGNSLSDQHKLVFPGGKGAYLFKDPVISEKGYLMTSLQFNGASLPPSSAATRMTSMVSNVVSGLLPDKAGRERKVFSTKMVHVPASQGSIVRGAEFQKESASNASSGGSTLDKPAAGNVKRDSGMPARTNA